MKYLTAVSRSSYLSNRLIDINTPDALWSAHNNRIYMCVCVCGGGGGGIDTELILSIMSHLKPEQCETFHHCYLNCELYISAHTHHAHTPVYCSYMCIFLRWPAILNSTVAHFLKYEENQRVFIKTQAAILDKRQSWRTFASMNLGVCYTGVTTLNRLTGQQQRKQHDSDMLNPSSIVCPTLG